MIGVEAVAHDRVTFWRSAYEEHGPAILAFLRARLAVRDDAEELLQETFLRAMRAEVGIRDLSRVRGYLFTTAHNLVKSHRRRARVSPLVPDTAQGEAVGYEATDTHASLRELIDRIGRLLETMPDAHRQAFELGVLERMPYRDIADRTGWSLAQVKINVYRARRRVIAELGDRLGEQREAIA